MMQISLPSGDISPMMMKYTRVGEWTKPQVSVVRDSGASPTVSDVLVLDYGCSEQPTEIKFESDIKEWNDGLEARFAELAETFAFGGFSSQSEETEYQHLKVLRRRYHHPRMPQEVMHEYRRKKMEKTLRDALFQYAKFIEIENQS